MRYATVVAGRVVARLIDEWNRRRLEDAQPADGGAQRTVAGLLAGLPQRTLVALLAVVRFIAVAAPPTSSSPKPSGTPAPPAPPSEAADAGPPSSPGGWTALGSTASGAASQPARLAAGRTGTDAIPLPGSVAVRARYVTSIEPHLPGAHPISPAAIVREARAGRAVRVPWRAIGMSLVAWLRPLAGLFESPGARTARAARSAASPVSVAASTTVGLGQRSQQRLVGGAVAVLIVAASIVGVSPVRQPIGGTGNVLGAASAPRLAADGASAGGGGNAGSDGLSAGEIAGLAAAAGAGEVDAAIGDDRSAHREASTAGLADNVDGATAPDADDLSYFTSEADAAGLAAGDPSASSPDIEAFSDAPGSGPEAMLTVSQAQAGFVTAASTEGPWLSDGTLLKPIAVNTTVPDARTLLVRYKVRKGDTLTSIAHRYGISMVTLYWANHLTTNLKTKTDLKVGQVLSVPPVNGVLHIVTDKETLKDISKRTGISTARIASANGLDQPTVFVGQWIIVPGAKAKPVPTVAPKPKPVARPAARPASRTPTTTTRTSKPTPKPVSRPTPRYSSGGWAWPAPGGHISQYYHYGHWAIDIADTYGAAVLAAKGGVVTFAGWKNNGGGWQVWISHGGNVYTTYNHMSSLNVGRGQYVGAGQRVGRIGASGDATGPHLHFEVWIGPIWSGGTRVNPLAYV